MAIRDRTELEAGRNPFQARVARIGHIGIAVRDLDATVEFYRRHIGLRLTERFEYPADDVGHGVAVTAGAFMRSGNDHHCISFFAVRNASGAKAEDGSNPYGLHHIAFEMGTPLDLLAKYREFRAAGLPIINARSGGPGNQPRFYATDPDGNLLEFFWGIDQIGWDNRPRDYPEIEEIDLEKFDFDAFVRRRERDAAERVSANISPSAGFTDLAAKTLRPEQRRAGR
jgi:catechol 2,3-dioxygenase-like lactoylglutathione lyase family enzyme